MCKLYMHNGGINGEHSNPNKNRILYLLCLYEHAKLTETDWVKIQEGKLNRLGYNQACFCFVGSRMTSTHPLPTF